MATEISTTEVKDVTTSNPTSEKIKNQNDIKMEIDEDMKATDCVVDETITTLKMEMQDHKNEDTNGEENGETVSVEEIPDDPEENKEQNEETPSITIDDDDDDEETTDKHEETEQEVPDVDESNKDTTEIEEEGDFVVDSHPYTYMIDNFDLTREQKIVTDIGAPKNLEETSLQMIQTRVQLIKLLSILKTTKEIALDFQIDQKESEGHMVLLEISTRDTDYIIDALKLRTDLLLLTEIFINPKIVKIIYKADIILAYLQQYLHLFMINIFDVEKAVTALEISNTTLNIILRDKYKCERDNRLHQADYSVRPLPDKFKKYVRSAPHYLIYMYHDYKNELINQDIYLYTSFMNECRDASKIIYPNRRIWERQLIEKELENRHQCELEVLERLYNWRNDVAQKKKQNPQIVLRKFALIELASTLPTTEGVITTMCNSGYVKDEIEEIINIIKESKTKYKLIDKKHGFRKKKQYLDILLKEADIPIKRKLNDEPESSGKRLKESPSNKSNEKFSYQTPKPKNELNMFKRNKPNRSVDSFQKKAPPPIKNRPKPQSNFVPPPTKNRPKPQSNFMPPPVKNRPKPQSNFMPPPVKNRPKPQSNFMPPRAAPGFTYFKQPQTSRFSAPVNEPNLNRNTFNMSNFQGINPNIPMILQANSTMVYDDQSNRNPGFDRSYEPAMNQGSNRFLNPRNTVGEREAEVLTRCLSALKTPRYDGSFNTNRGQYGRNKGRRQF